MKKVVASLFCLLLPFSAGIASAQGTLYGAHTVGPAEPLLLFGQPIPGVIGQSNGSARVEIRTILGTNSIVPVSASDGSDDAKNPLLQVSHVGVGVLSSKNTGNFDLILNSSILTNRLFVRVYNTDDPSTATYYFDSEAFKFQIDNITLSRKVAFSAPKSILPAEQTDSDGDGLTDLEETSGVLGYVTDPFKADSDGDGINDDVELVYGLDPTQALTVVLTSTPAASPSSVVPFDQDWMVEWAASTNPYVLYTLEMVQDLLDIQEGDFPSAAAAQRVVRSKKDIQASRTNWSELVTEWMQTNHIGFFRVRQDLQPLPEDDAAEPDEGAGD